VVNRLYEFLGRIAARITYPIVKRTRRGREFLEALNWYADGGQAGADLRTMVEKQKEKTP
jgi:hypothetical protein